MGCGKRRNCLVARTYSEPLAGARGSGRSHDHKGVRMGLRPINDNENRLGAGSVSDLASSAFPLLRHLHCFSRQWLYQWYVSVLMKQGLS